MTDWQPDRITFSLSTVPSIPSAPSLTGQASISSTARRGGGAVLSENQKAAVVFAVLVFLNLAVWGAKEMLS